MLRRAGPCLLSLVACAGAPAHATVASEPALAEPAASDPSPGPESHTALAVPPGHRLRFQADAKGVQIYECQANEASADWVLQAPEAELFDAAGGLAGKHFAGPTWESVDGSRVVAAKVEEETPDSGAIPWLLLRASGHEGSGSLSAISFIQRRNTTGGLAPEDGCDAAHSGETSRVPYSAVYYFYERSD